MRTILPQSSVSSVISTASGRWRRVHSCFWITALPGGHCSCHWWDWSR